LAVQQRFKRVELDRFKQEIREHVTHYLYEQTQRSPIVIPVVNESSGGGKSRDRKPSANNAQSGNGKNKPAKKEPTSEEIAAEQQRRFEEMRAKLLGQDARTD